MHECIIGESKRVSGCIKHFPKHLRWRVLLGVVLLSLFNLKMRFQMPEQPNTVIDQGSASGSQAGTGFAGEAPPLPASNRSWPGRKHEWLHFTTQIADTEAPAPDNEVMRCTVALFWENVPIYILYPFCHHFDFDGVLLDGARCRFAPCTACSVTMCCLCVAWWDSGILLWLRFLSYEALGRSV